MRAGSAEGGHPRSTFEGRAGEVGALEVVAACCCLVTFVPFGSLSLHRSAAVGGGLRSLLGEEGP